jgi:hypothetical protein
MSIIKKDRIIVIGQEDDPLVMGYILDIKLGFRDRFDVDAIPYLRPTENNPSQPSELLMKMHRQRAASLVILFDTSSSEEAYEIMKPDLLKSININIGEEVDKLMQEVPSDTTLEAHTGDPIRDSIIQESFTNVFETGRKKVRDDLTEQFEKKREAAMGHLLDNVPCTEGERVITEMRRSGSLQDVPLLVIGLDPSRKETFAKLGGQNTLIFTSSDFFVNKRLRDLFVETKPFIEQSTSRKK